MTINRRTRVTAVAGTTIGILSLAACDRADARLEQLSVGMSRDSTVQVLSGGAATGDSVANVYSREEYLSQGQVLEVLFYSPDGAREGVDPVAAERLTPIVLKDGTLATIGWAGYDSVAAVHGLTRTIQR